MSRTRPAPVRRGTVSDLRRGNTLLRSSYTIFTVVVLVLLTGVFAVKARPAFAMAGESLFEYGFLETIFGSKTDSDSLSSSSINFESFANGSPNGQAGWSATGAAPAGPGFDHQIVTNVSAPPSFGAKSLRISNSVTSGSFADQTYTASLAEEAGETSAQNGGKSSGPRQNRFSVQWDFASTVPGAEQPGLSVTASPDRGDGARMSWVQMTDTPTGITVNFQDYQRGFGPCSSGLNFVTTPIATGLARSSVHTIRMEMDFYDGVANDVVRVYVDGSLRHVGTSWEDYFRDCESNPTRTVDSLIFRTGGTAAPANAGKGFLIDNMSFNDNIGSSSTTTVSNVNPQGWLFLNEGPVGSGSFVNGPAPAPLGVGSVQLLVDANGRENFLRPGNFGQRLDQITQLSYSSHQVSGNPATTVSLQLQVDYDVTDANNAFQGRLVFEPYQTPGNVVQQNAWQTWSALSGRWWVTGAPGNTTCGQATPCSWAQLLANWPNLGIHSNPLLGAIIFRAGGPNGSPFTGSVDNFTLGISGVNTTYNFDPTQTYMVDDDGFASPGNCAGSDPAYSTVAAAVAGANIGDTISICSGTYPTAATINLDKNNLTIIGGEATKPVLQAASSIGNLFFVTGSNVTLDNLEIQKTDTANQNLIAVQGNNFTAQNNLIYGPNPGGTWSATGFISRAFVISVTNNLLLQNNTIHTLRQPAYMSGNDSSGGTIANNNVSGTKGWVVEGGDFNFTGNTWGEPQNQDCDIALIASANPVHYSPLLSLSQANDNAFICAQYTGGENGRATVFVDNSSPLNGSDNAPYAFIQDGVNGALAGGEVQVASGTYVEDVLINKPLKVTGAGSASTTISGAIGGPSGSTVTIGASNVEFSKFKITREGNTVAQWNDPNLNSVGVAIQGLSVTNALIHDNLIQGNRTGIDINNSGGHTVRNNVVTFNRTGFIFRNQTDNMTVVENAITNNWTVGVVFLDASGGTNSPVQSAVGGTFYNNDLSDNWFANIVDRQTGGALPAPGTNLKNFGGNWFGAPSPVITTANSTEPGYAAQIPTTYGGGASAPGGQPHIAGPASANFLTSPRLATGVDTDVETTPGRGTFGFQGNFAAANFVVTPASSPTAADNDYTRINNAIQAAGSGDTIVLNGSFNWTEANAAASWALGSDGVASTLDDYSILVPANRNNITFTATSLGAATIQGPGDLAAINLEGVLFFNGGDNQGWVMSNIRYLDFDIAIGMFNGAGGADAFNGTQIINNYIRIPSDLNTSVASADVNQNIGIHYANGTNQIISGNTIETPGTGVSNSAGGQFSSVVGMQSNSTGGNSYNGLQITNNTLRVLGTQSADPETFLGIWENGHAHSSNITVSGNQFLNASAGNNPAVNLQRAFRVTSHSSATTTVTYANNYIQGANIGFQWLAGNNFTGNQPVRLTSNTILGGGTGVLVQSNGSAEAHFNRIVGNSVAGVNNASAGAVNAENNWWGCNFGPGAGGAGCAGTANGVLGTVDASPWLTLTTIAAPTSISLGGSSTVTSRLVINSSSSDTSASGSVPNGTPASFAGVRGTVAPPTGTTTGGVTGTTFTGTAYGVGSASTTVDGQTVSSPITVEPACATVSIPDGITTLPNTEVIVPINTTDLTTRGAFGYETTITYDSSVMSFVAFDQSGTLSSGLTVATNSSTPGTVSVTAFSTTASPLAGAGLLLKLRFMVVGGISSTPSPVNFASFVFNEGDPCSVTDGGSVTVISGTISGTVTYVNGVPTTPGVPNVTLQGTGTGGNVSTTTSGSGTYTLSGFGAGAYTVTPSKPALPLGSPNSAISNTDATRIAQHTLGIITLTANQIIAGDVSGNGTVSNLDATYISQWKVNIANPGTTGTWVFQPASRNYPNVNSSLTGENYNAILKGDVTGNWNPTEAPFLAEILREPSKDAVRVGAPRMDAASGSDVVVPVTISNLTDKGVTGYEFAVTYDPNVLEPAEIGAELAGTISEGMTIVSNAVEPGRLAVVVFGTAPMNGEGLLVNLRLRAIGAVGTSTTLGIEQLMLNEGEIESAPIAGELRVVQSAQPGTVRGRLLTSTGDGVTNATIVATSTTGQTRSTKANTFGNFVFANLQPGETYTLTVQSRRHTFIPMSVTANDSVVNVDLIAQ